MTPDAPAESGPDGRTLRDLGLDVAGTRLEPILAAFRRELEQAGVTGVTPEFYLATEWGVPFPSAAVAIPFYLARPDLIALHAERAGLVEGNSRADILRYLRHETGHVVNYAYRLYERPDWLQAFGPFDREYPEEYSPRPFSRDHVSHLPGWYAQKHPDEDWAETFAVWMTPGLDWRREYAGWPGASAKLDYCDRMMTAVAGTPSLLGELPADEDEDADDLFAYTPGEIYSDDEDDEAELPGLDGALRTAFDDFTPAAGGQVPVSQVVRTIETDVVANVFRWTGHFPERTRPLLRQIVRRADALGQVVPAGREAAAAVALTALVTALAMNHVYHGDYSPAAEHP